MTGPSADPHARRQQRNCADWHHITGWVADERRRLDEDPEASRTPAIAGEVRYLLGSIDWCSRQGWVDELAEDLRQIHRQARRRLLPVVVTMPELHRAVCGQPVTIKRSACDAVNAGPRSPVSIYCAWAQPLLKGWHEHFHDWDLSSRG